MESNEQVNTPVDRESTYVSEVTEALDQNANNLGKLWALRKDSLQRKEIATTMRQQAHNYWAVIDARLFGTVPSGPSLAAQAASALRNFARKNQSGRHDARDPPPPRRRL